MITSINEFKKYNAVNEAAKAIFGLAGVVKDINVHPEYFDFISDDTKAKMKEFGVTSKAVFNFSSMFPRDTFKIQDIISGKLLARVKAITFDGPGLENNIKQIEILQDIVNSMDAYYKDRSWTSKY